MSDFPPKEIFHTCPGLQRVLTLQEEPDVVLLQHLIFVQKHFPVHLVHLEVCLFFSVKECQRTRDFKKEAVC